MLLTGLVLFVWLLGAYGELTCTVDTNALNAALAQLESQGYTIEEDNFYRFTAEIFNYPLSNQDSRYGPSNFQRFGQLFLGTAIRGTDAVVFHECTPPESTYVGYSTYLTAIVFGDASQGEFNETASSMGNSINQFVMKTEDSLTAPFDALATIVSTGDQTTYNDIYDAFASYGLGDSVNLSPIPDQYFPFSPNDAYVPRGTVGATFRVVQPFVEEDWETYIATDKPLYLIRGPATDEDFGPRVPYEASERSTFTFVNENILLGRVFERTVDQIVDYFTGEGYTYLERLDLVSEGAAINEEAGVWIPEHGFYCLDNNKNCIADNRDTTYFFNPSVRFVTENDYYLFLGVDHTQFGISIYSSFGAYVLQDRQGNPLMPVAGTISDEFDEWPIDDTPVPFSYFGKFRRKKLVLAQFARSENCIDDILPLCVGDEELFVNEPIVFAGRAHLNPWSKTRPDEDKLLPYVVLHFTVPSQ